MSDFIDGAVLSLSSGFLLFLIASGLTLVFGIMHVVNFAHGGFFMVGAYIAYEVGTRWGDGSLSTFLVACVVAAAATSLIGVVIEYTVLRRLYAEPGIYTLLATFGLLLVAQGSVQWVWGADPVGVSVPDRLRGSLGIFGAEFSAYRAFIIAVAVVITLALFMIVYRTQFGLAVRAVAHDRSVASAVGLRINFLFTAMFCLGTFLAGLAGALQAPLIQMDPSLGGNFVILGFAAVIIGGLGSIGGALLASMILSTFNSFAILYTPAIQSYAVYIAFVIVLCLRPQGLMHSSSKEALA